MNSKIHVMHIIDGLGVGGTETILYELIGGLILQGFRITVCYFNPGPLVDKYSNLDVSLIHVPFGSRIDSLLFFRLIRIIRREKPQIVHTHLFKSDFHGLLAARINNVPVILTTLHSMNDWARFPLFGWIYGFILRLADKVIVLSDEISDFFSSRCKVPKERFLTIHNAIPIRRFLETDGNNRKIIRDEFDVASEEILYGFIARLAPPKDHPMFLRAAVMILEKNPRARFMIVGEGESKTALIALSSELGIENKVIFTGFRGDIPEIMAALDVVVLASRFEGMPVVLMEAMASSRPIVATISRGIVSVVTHEENGLLVPQGDSDALASACLRLENDDQLRERLVKSGLALAISTFNIETNISKTADFYRETLQKKNRAMMHPIRLLQVAKSTGGVGMYMRRLVESLDREKYLITAVCLAEGGADLARELSQLKNVDAINIEMKDNIDPITDMVVCVKLARIIRAKEFDLVHAHTSKPGFFARLAAIGTGIPVLYQPANFAFHDGAPRAQAILYGLLEGFAAKFLTERIITVCNGERELARRFSVGWDELFVTILTGIDINKFDIEINRVLIRKNLGIPADVFVVGTVARLTEAKAPQDFIHAAKLINNFNPQTHFLWVGNGPLEEDSRRLVTELGLDSVFHFSGHRNDIPSVLKAMDIFVLTSHWEGFSIAVLEAMAAGLPIVSTRVMGASEAIIEGENGILTGIGDIQSIADGITRLIKHPLLAKKFGNASKIRAKAEFPFSKMLNSIEHLYEEVYNKYAS